MILRLTRHHLDLLREESQKTYPVEACAMLFGDLTSEGAVIRKVVVAPNKLLSSERFEIAPEMAVEATTKAEDEGLDFVGLFHSHPAPAIPSTIDLKFMKLWGDAIWLILSSTDDNFAAYRMRDSEPTEMTIIVK
ncbi:MAG: M67 family metallopeptidase [Candidatus Bathyarchaeota archaeon]|nr:M67 family metallopeptidase [Candidatus Bathyarchaeota archaeon]MDH5732358.1 M67 family metallopeptidase [Candidatus Bathyarchaeota archaeon]